MGQRMSGESPRNRIDAAVQALKRHDEGTRVAEVLEHGWYESMARDALAAADEVERPVAERLAAALLALSGHWHARQGPPCEICDRLQDESLRVLAEFRAHSTDGD